MPAANPQPHIPRPPAGDRSAAARPARRVPADRVQRHRRERHRRRLRRDRLEDFGLALLLAGATLIIAAGLGVIALLEVPALGAVIVSFGLERRVHARRGAQPTRGRYPASRAASVSVGPSGSRRRGGSSRR